MDPEAKRVEALKLRHQKLTLEAKFLTYALLLLAFFMFEMNYGGFQVRESVKEALNIFTFFLLIWAAYGMYGFMKELDEIEMQVSSEIDTGNHLPEPGLGTVREKISQKLKILPPFKERE